MLNQTTQPSSTKPIKVILLFVALALVLAFIFLPVVDLATVRVFDIFAQFIEITRGGILVIFAIIIAYYIWHQYSNQGKNDNEQERT